MQKNSFYKEAPKPARRLTRLQKLGFAANLRKYKLTSCLLILSLGLAAQDGVADVVEPAASGLWASFNTVEKVLVVFIIVTIILAINTILYLNNSLMHVQKMRVLEKYAPEQLEALGINKPIIHQEPFWQRMYKRWTNVVPIEKEADIMLDHDYDGIRELDNSLPPWWLATFYAAVIFAPIYIWFVHFSEYGHLSSEEYAIEMEQAERDVEAYLAKQANTVDENSVFTMMDPEELASGQLIYTAKCVICHGTEGEGGIGPNFTDQYWLHGGSINDVFRTVKYGVVEKGMQAWRKELRPVQMQQVSSYILSMVGNSPANPKAPQGELYVPLEVETIDSTDLEEEAIPASDETSINQ